MLSNDVKLLAVVDTFERKLSKVQLTKGDKGDTGKQGPKGEKGDRGLQGPSGATGPKGADGKEGPDGKQGEQGVSVVDATVDFDNHLVLTLSNGEDIDAGYINIDSDKGDTIVNVSVSKPGGASGSLSTNLDLNNKGFTATFPVGESVLAGDLCTMNLEGKMVKASSLSEDSTKPLIGIAISDAALDETVPFLTKGFYEATGFTANSLLYVGEAGGSISEVPPTTTGYFQRIVGYATNTDSIFFDPDKTYLELV